MASEKMDLELRAKLKSLPAAHEKQEIYELPHWVKIALTRCVINNLTYAESAKVVRRSAATLQEYARSPAGRAWREQLADFASDPVTLAKAVLVEGAADVTLDRFAIFEAAKASGDWALADKIARDLQDRMGVIPQKSNENQGMSITVNFAGGNFDAPVIEADWENPGDE